MKVWVHGYSGALAITVAAMVFAYLLEVESGPVAGLTAVLVVVTLGLLETALSLESVAVNAKVLGGMSRFWRGMFVATGLLVTIFGMRFVFPLLIVWAVGDHGFWTMVSLVMQDSMEFRQILQTQFAVFAGFGGAFLLMAFTGFFMDPKKEEHWIRWLERPMWKLGRLKLMSVVATGAISQLFSVHVPNGQGHKFLAAAMLGIATYLLVELMITFLQSGWEKVSVGRPQQGWSGLTSSLEFASLLYLVLLGTSFSFHVVIGAFSLTSNLLIILLGLGVGVLFIQLLSVRLISETKPRAYPFLKHGVFWANGVLSLGLYLQAVEWVIPEVLIGSVGTGFIGSSFVSSLRHRRAC